METLKFNYRKALSDASSGAKFNRRDAMAFAKDVSAKLKNAPPAAKEAFKKQLGVQLSLKTGVDAVSVEDIKFDLEKQTAKVFYKDDAGQINIIEMGMAALALIVIVSLYIVFKIVFPAMAGQTMLSMNVTATNPMYNTVSGAGSTASGMYGMADIVMYMLMIATVAVFGLAIFQYHRGHA